MPDLTLGELVDATLQAYERLVALGEEIEDEWSYVNRLAASWRGTIATAVAAQADRPADVPTRAALAALVDEADAITDPHRAIDWLSTFPQVALLALGEPI
jgi:hypothetical protein